MKPESEVIRGRGAGGVEVADLEVTFADEVVIADYHARDGGEEDAVGRQIGCEVVGGA